MRRPIHVNRQERGSPGACLEVPSNEAEDEGCLGRQAHKSE